MKTQMIIVAVFCGLLATPTYANDEQQSEPQQLPRVALLDVLDAVSNNTDRVFAVTQDVDPNVVVGHLDLREMNYDALLVVLRNNNLAAVRYSDLTNIVHGPRVRQDPLPIIYEKNDSIADGEWVTMLIEVENAQANMFVPILRPLVPQAGHLVAHAESNTLSIVDRYGNVKRLLELVRKMDAATTPQSRQ